MRDMLQSAVTVSYRSYHSTFNTGLVAQWIRHLTTNQGIAGSSPAKIKFFVKLFKTRKVQDLLFCQQQTL